MTYNMSSGTLNPTIPYDTIPLKVISIDSYFPDTRTNTHTHRNRPTAVLYPTSTSVFGNRISTHADPTRGQRFERIGKRTGRARWPARRPARMAHALADSSNFGLLGKLLGKQGSPKCKISCPGRRQTAVQNSKPLALSSAEKSVTVQTNKQTVKDISTPCPSECVDNKQYRFRCFPATFTVAQVVV